MSTEQHFAVRTQGASRAVPARTSIPGLLTGRSRRRRGPEPLPPGHGQPGVKRPGRNTPERNPGFFYIRPRYDDDVQRFDRITMDPEVMGGKPCIRGMRVTVGMILEAMAAGRTVQELLADFPYIEEPDIREALAFAARLAQGREIQLAR
jgi:uncharacterized protein (DUF433 family)